MSESFGFINGQKYINVLTARNVGKFFVYIMQKLSRCHHCFELNLPFA